MGGRSQVQVSLPPPPAVVMSHTVVQTFELRVGGGQGGAERPRANQMQPSRSSRLEWEGSQQPTALLAGGGLSSPQPSWQAEGSGSDHEKGAPRASGPGTAPTVPVLRAGARGLCPIHSHCPHPSTERRAMWTPRSADEGSERGRDLPEATSS